MRKTIVGLDAMRFVLAVYLMVFHTIHAYPQANTLPLIWLTDLGGFATSTFFILSGFILTHVYIDRGPALRGGTRNFVVKRLSEIYPINFVGLILFAVVLSVSHRSFDSVLVPSMGRGYQQMIQLNAAPAAFNWLLNTLMLQVWDPRYSSINAPSWTLGCLLFFYLCFPIVAPRFARMRRTALMLVVLWLLYLVPPLTIVLMGAYTPVPVGMIEHNPILRIPEFLSGILLYSLYSSGRLSWMLGARWRKAAAAAFVLGSFILASRLIATGPLAVLYIVHNGALLPAELALVALCANAYVPQWAHKTVSRLGNAALSIFGIHVALFELSMDGLKLMATHESISRCVAHFSACAATAKAIHPSMATYPIYLIATVIAAVLFQERCFVPVRTAIRQAFVRDRRRIAAPSGLSSSARSRG